MAICCASKSRQLMHQIHLLLLRLGIVSSFQRKHTEKLSYIDKPYTSWRITIQGEDVLKYAREIGFNSTRKQQQLGQLLLKMNAADRNPNKDIVPVELVRPLMLRLKQFRDEMGISFPRKDYKDSSTGLHCLQNNYLDLVKFGVSRDKIESCALTLNTKATFVNGDNGVAVADVIELGVLTDGWWDENYFFDTVASIEEKEADLYDLEVEGAHCYWTNGFISHNTTIMRAIQLAANPCMFRGRERESDLVLRKSIYDEEYLPTVDMMSNKAKSNMEITVEFLTDQGIKTVIIDNMGLVQNDLGYEDIPINGFTYFADADNAQNTQKFLLAFEQAPKFVAFAQEVYGYKCELGMPVSEQGIAGYTDFYVVKGPTKVHFKSMSAGEKKIATLVSDLCQPVNIDRRDIVLIDNVEMHVYFKRHARMIDKLREVFYDKQIITTTHSSVVIDHLEPECRYDLELYRPDYKLMDTAVPVASVVLAKPEFGGFGFSKQTAPSQPVNWDSLIEKMQAKAAKGTP